MAEDFPGGTVFFGTLCATPSMGVPWGHLEPNFDGFWEHWGQLSAIVDGFGKHFRPDLSPATVHMSFFFDLESQGHCKKGSADSRRDNNSNLT